MLKRFRVDMATTAGRWQLLSIVLAIMLIAVSLYSFWPETKTVAGNAGKGAPPGGYRFAVGVEAGVVEQGEIQMLFEGLGSVQALQSIDIITKQSRRVNKLYFKPGQLLNAGENLLSFDNREVWAEFEEDAALYQQAKLNAKRAERLVKAKNISQEEHDTLQAEMRATNARLVASQARLDDTTIKAPFDGVVGLNHVSEGALIESGTLITTFDDISRVKVLFTVPEIHLAKLKPGLPIEAISTAYPEHRFAGEVAAVDSRVNPQTRSIDVVGILPNDGNLLRPGLFMTVRLSLDIKQGALLVPEKAIFPKGQQQYVYSVVDGKAILSRVSIGLRSFGKVEILEGLKAGDQIVTMGQQKLREGLDVNIINATALNKSSDSTSASIQ